MVKNYFCVSLPRELMNYQKKMNILTPNIQVISYNSNVKVNNNDKGSIASVDYYSSQNDLIKRVYYKGSSIICINHYRYGKLYSKEDYEDNLVISKIFYDTSGAENSRVTYEYNSRKKTTGIRKVLLAHNFYIKYGYDELERVNLRKIFYNDKQVSEQRYRYDILDRISEYRDDNQLIRVLSLSAKNELISYKITDKMGNEISITNHFTDTSYVNTDVDLNGHSMTVRDRSYVDNVMLKKPYTNEDDLDLIISNLMKQVQNTSNKESVEEIIAKKSTGIIDDCIEKRTLPISIRKRIIYNIATNAQT